MTLVLALGLLKPGKINSTKVEYVSENVLQKQTGEGITDLGWRSEYCMSKSVFPGRGGLNNHVCDSISKYAGPRVVFEQLDCHKENAEICQ